MRNNIQLKFESLADNQTQTRQPIGFSVYSMIRAAQCLSKWLNEQLKLYINHIRTTNNIQGSNRYIITNVLGGNDCIGISHEPIKGGIRYRYQQFVDLRNESIDAEHFLKCAQLICADSTLANEKLLEAYNMLQPVFRKFKRNPDYYI
ncbi:hypothetical protein QTO12_05915 [Vibrio owensii]|uniref:hypothetical protein n=1 Tax=Vibrio owensii TaxID=696485 RepID=UPI002F413AAF